MGNSIQHIKVHALNLLEDDNQWDCMLAEAALYCTGTQIRLLFAIVSTTCFPARSQMLWDNHKDSMTDEDNVQGAKF